MSSVPGYCRLSRLSRLSGPGDRRDRSRYYRRRHRARRKGRWRLRNWWHLGGRNWRGRRLGNGRITRRHGRDGRLRRNGWHARCQRCYSHRIGPEPVCNPEAIRQARKIRVETVGQSRIDRAHTIGDRGLKWTRPPIREPVGGVGCESCGQTQSYGYYFHEILGEQRECLSGPAHRPLALSGFPAILYQCLPEGSLLKRGVNVCAWRQAVRLFSNCKWQTSPMCLGRMHS
jgi:hypothetical protein